MKIHRECVVIPTGSHRQLKCKTVISQSYLELIKRFMDNSPTNQLADSQLADRPTRWQTYSPKLL